MRTIIGARKATRGGVGGAVVLTILSGSTCISSSLTMRSRNLRKRGKTMSERGLGAFLSRRGLVAGLAALGATALGKLAGSQRVEASHEPNEAAYDGQHVLHV